MIAVHTQSKSRFYPSKVGAIIRRAARASLYVPRTMPVIVGREVVGLMRGGGGVARFTPVTHRQWCGFGGYAAIDAAAKNGQENRAFYLKDFSTDVSLSWTDCWNCVDVPAAGAFTGTANTLRQFDNTTLGGLNINATTPSAGQTRHLVGWSNIGAQISNPAPNISGLAMIYDRVATYESVSISSSPTTLTNTLAPARYVSSGQDGLLISVTVQTVFGATASSLSSMTVTDQNGNTNVALTPGYTLNWYTSAPAPTTTSGCIVVLPRDLTNGASPTPFVPLPANVSGVRQVTAFTSSATNTGSACIVLLHPVGLVWMTSESAAWTDLCRAGFALERVYDTACLSFMIHQATSNPLKMQGWLRITHA